MRNKFSLLYFCLLFSASAVAAPLYDVITLPPAKISADATQTSATKSTAITTVITAQQIQQMGATQITQVLATDAAVQVQDLYGDGNQVQVSMAGFGENSLNNVAILVDGIPLNNPDLGSVNINQIPLSNVERIEITKEGNGVLYGDGAVGGVINIITKTPEKFSGQVGLNAGSYQQQGGTARISNRTGPWQYSASVDHEQAQGFRTNDQSSRDQYATAVSYQLAHSVLGMRWQQENAQEQYPGSLTQAEEDNDPTQSGAGSGYFNDIEQLGEIFYNYHWSDAWSLNNLFAMRHTQGEGAIGDSAFTQARNIYSFNPELNGNFVSSRGWGNLKSGLYLEQDNYDLSYNPTTYQRQSGAAYTQLTIPLIKNWQVLVGSRAAESQSQLAPTQTISNQAFIHSEGLAWQITQHVDWYLRRAGNYRFPKLDEYGNTPTLQTQTGVMYSTGMDYQISTLESHFDLYELDLNHEIAYDPTPIPGAPFGTNVNLDPTRRQGFSFTQSWQVAEPWRLGGTYAYVNGIFTSGNFTGNHIPLVAQQKFTAFSNVTFNSHWSWYLATILVGSRYPGSDNENVGPTLSPTEVVNTNVMYQLAHWHINFALNNVTNAQYVESAYLSGDQLGYYPAPGRNFLASINYEF